MTNHVETCDPSAVGSDRTVGGRRGRPEPARAGCWQGVRWRLLGTVPASTWRLLHPASILTAVGRCHSPDAAQRARGGAEFHGAARGLCRHPLSTEQVELVDRYATADGNKNGAGLELARHVGARRHRPAPSPDYHAHQGRGAGRMVGAVARRPLPRPHSSETRSRARRPPGARWHDLPEGNASGGEYVEFYRRQGLALPGDDTFIPRVSSSPTT